MSFYSSQQETFDLVGLGFGPANIAIAGALTEAWQNGEVSQNSYVY